MSRLFYWEPRKDARESGEAKRTKVNSIQLLLSFPHSRSRVSSRVPFTRDFSRLPELESLPAGLVKIHSPIFQGGRGAITRQ